MVLELKGKLAAPPAEAALGGSEGGPEGRVAAPGGQAALVQEALVRMGFRPSEAERAVAAVADYDRPLGQLVREALSILAP